MCKRCCFPICYVGEVGRSRLAAAVLHLNRLSCVAAIGQLLVNIVNVLVLQRKLLQFFQEKSPSAIGSPIGLALLAALSTLLSIVLAKMARVAKSYKTRKMSWRSNCCFLLLAMLAVAVALCSTSVAGSLQANFEAGLETAVENSMWSYAGESMEAKMLTDGMNFEYGCCVLIKGNKTTQTWRTEFTSDWKKKKTHYVPWSCCNQTSLSCSFDEYLIKNATPDAGTFSPSCTWVIGRKFDTVHTLAVLFAGLTLLLQAVALVPARLLQVAIANLIYIGKRKVKVPTYLLCACVDAKQHRDVFHKHDQDDDEVSEDSDEDDSEDEQEEEEVGKGKAVALAARGRLPGTTAPSEAEVDSEGEGDDGAAGGDKGGGGKKGRSKPKTKQKGKEKSKQKGKDKTKGKKKAKRKSGKKGKARAGKGKDRLRGKGKAKKPAGGKGGRGAKKGGGRKR